VRTLLRLFVALLVRLPERSLAAFSVFAGDATFFLARKRRRTVLGNLRHAFPDKSEEWIRATGRESLRQMVENGLLGAALGQLPEERLKQIFTMPDASRDVIQAKLANGRPTIICAPHLGPQEGLSLLPWFEPKVKVGVIYRPLNNPAFDEWIRSSRGRFGMQLFPRKESLQKAIRQLRTGGWVGLLFDQNTGRQGSLMTFMDRLASVTDLPAILGSRGNAQVIYAYSARQAFWRVELRFEDGPSGLSKEDLTFAMNRWLEGILRENDQLRPTWLWAHNRWRHHRVPPLGLREKRNLLPAQNAFLGRREVPRRERFFVRLPNWLGDVVMLLPLLRALRQSRPDAAITVIGKAALLPLVRDAGLCEETIALPPRGSGYFPFFWKLRARNPVLQILFTNSPRGDLEAWLTGATSRFGMLRPGKRRPLLSHSWAVPADLNEAEIHQTRVWEQFLRHFGLEGEIDSSPVQFKGIMPADSETPIVGMICGTENFPAKRWPIASWRKLVEVLLTCYPDVSIELFGTPADRAITSQVADCFPVHRISNLAGLTDLPQFMARLAACSVIISNDTGGMHLANAIGVPVAGLFGPTNPVRTGPVFDAPKMILQPDGCPPTGGGSMEEISVDQVLDAVAPYLN